MESLSRKRRNQLKQELAKAGVRVQRVEVEAPGPCADLQRPLRRRLQTLDAERTGEPDDAEAGSEAMLGMKPSLSAVAASAAQIRLTPRSRNSPKARLMRAASILLFASALMPFLPRLKPFR